MGHETDGNLVPIWDITGYPNVNPNANPNEINGNAEIVNNPNPQPNNAL